MGHKVTGDQLYTLEMVANAAQKLLDKMTYVEHSPYLIMLKVALTAYNREMKEVAECVDCEHVDLVND